MQLTIDIKESALDKVMYILENLKSDVKIINKYDTQSLDIELISKDDDDYQLLENGRKERTSKPENYGSINDIDWN